MAEPTTKAELHAQISRCNTTKRRVVDDSYDSNVIQIQKWYWTLRVTRKSNAECSYKNFQTEDIASQEP